MTGDELPGHLREMLDPEAIGDLAEAYGTQERERKRNVFASVVALIQA